MKVNFYLTPLDMPIQVTELKEPTRLIKLIKPKKATQEDMDWFKENAAIALDGEIIPPNKWPYITLKPKERSVVDIAVIPGNKKTFAILAAVAAVALTAGIATYGLPFLGTAFAAGSLGANVAAAGVGIAGSLLVGALTAPPKVGNSGDERKTSNAGVNANTATLLDNLPGVVGRVGFSPPHLFPPYTTWDGDEVYVNAAVGCEGRCLIEDVKINGIDITSVAKATYEIREGKIGDAPRTMFTETVIEERDNITLSNFITDLETTKNDTLKDQTTPANSSPQWHSFQTAGKFTKVAIRFMFPSGIIDVAENRSGFVAIRIQIRKKGDTDWRKMPTIHIQDVNKGAGPMRCEINLRRENPPGGRHYVWAEQEFPVTSINSHTGYGEAFEYEADDYFNPNYQYPFWGVFGPSTGLTSNTAPSPFVASASSETGGAAWRAFDNSGVSTYWSPANGSVPGAWLKLDLGSAKTIRCYEFRANYSSVSARPTHQATKWIVEGSNDDSNWTLISTIDDSDNTFPTGWFNIESPGSYRYYRWTFNEVVSGTVLRVAHIVPHEGKCPGLKYGDYTGANEYGQRAPNQFGSSTSYTKCVDCLITEKGADIYLRPDDWDEGEYEIRIMRSQAGAYANLVDELEYSYNGTKANADYFDYRLSSGLYKIWIGQKNYRSDCTVEAFQTWDSTESPFDDTGIAMIAVSAPSIQINSIYGVFTKYASIFNGEIWEAEKVPTTNPAAHYRDTLLGAGNRQPVPGESIDTSGLSTWYENCVAAGHESNAVLSTAIVGDVKQLIATAGFASPWDAHRYGVIEDRDTSSDPIRYLITPNNSKSEGNTSEIRIVPHAIRAEFNNEDNSFAVDHVIVYRPGYSAANATLFETINYIGYTNSAKVEARALFDLKQMYLRQAKYAREVGLEFIGIRRGDVVGLADPIVDGDRNGGWIKSVQTSGGNVVSITIDSQMPWGRASDIGSIDDVSSLADVMNPSEPMGVTIRIPGANAITKQISEVSDSNVCTFTTPFPDDGSIVPDLLVAAGRFAMPVRRCKVVSVQPRGFEKRLLILTDEAPELFA